MKSNIIISESERPLSNNDHFQRIDLNKRNIRVEDPTNRPSVVFSRHSRITCDKCICFSSESNVGMVLRIPNRLKPLDKDN